MKRLHRNEHNTSRFKIFHSRFFLLIPISDKVQHRITYNWLTERHIFTVGQQVHSKTVEWFRLPLKVLLYNLTYVTNKLPTSVWRQQAGLPAYFDTQKQSVRRLHKRYMSCQYSYRVTNRCLSIPLTCAAETNCTLKLENEIKLLYRNGLDRNLFKHSPSPF